MYIQEFTKNAYIDIPDQRQQYSHYWISSTITIWKLHDQYEFGEEIKVIINSYVVSNTVSMNLVQ